MKKQLKYTLRYAASKLGLISGKPVGQLDKWKRESHEFELEFHKNNKFRQTEAFMEETSELFGSFGFAPRQFVGATVLDVGAGSKMRGKYFEGANIIALKPLAQSFIAEIPWCDLKDAAAVYSTPAEELIPDLIGRVDFIFSLNVLDHCYDFEAIILNLASYLKQGGLIFLSFDSHFTASVGHPLVLTEAACKSAFARAALSISSFQRGFPKDYEKLCGKKGYDGSSACLNYWLRRDPRLTARAD